MSSTADGLFSGSCWPPKWWSFWCSCVRDVKERWCGGTERERRSVEESTNRAKVSGSKGKTRLQPIKTTKHRSVWWENNPRRSYLKRVIDSKLAPHTHSCFSPGRSSNFSAKKQTDNSENLIEIFGLMIPDESWETPAQGGSTSD